MKNFNYLHLSGLSAVGLIVACLAQHWFGDHPSYSRALSYKPSSETIQTAQAEHAEASARSSLLREDRQKEELQRARLQSDRQKREQAWQAFYKQPAACHNPSTNVLFTACADEHIRAKREFEQSYMPNQPMAPFQSQVATAEQ